MCVTIEGMFSEGGWRGGRGQDRKVKEPIRVWFQLEAHFLGAHWPMRKPEAGGSSLWPHL